MYNVDFIWVSPDFICGNSTANQPTFIGKTLYYLWRLPNRRVEIRANRLIETCGFSKIIFKERNFKKGIILNDYGSCTARTNAKRSAEIIMMLLTFHLRNLCFLKRLCCCMSIITRQNH